MFENMTRRSRGCGTSTCPKGQESQSRGGRRRNGDFDQAGRDEDVVGVEGEFETAHESEVRPAWPPDVEVLPGRSIRDIKSVSRRSIRDAKSAFQGEWGEEQHRVAFDGRGALEDLDCGLGKAADCIVVRGSREECEVERATGAGDEGVREAGAVGDLVQGGE